MNQYEVIRATFPDATRDEVDELAKSHKFVNECEKYLTDNKGYEFGCGRKDGCNPFCTC